LFGSALSINIISKCSFIELSDTIVNLVKNSSTRCSSSKGIS
jgi:hypothetical protein